jgi:hypothetical protein
MRKLCRKWPFMVIEAVRIERRSNFRRERWADAEPLAAISLSRDALARVFLSWIVDRRY